jgi:flagellin-like protein
VSDRAVSPVIGVVLLIAVTLVAAAVLGVTVFGIAQTDPPPQATFTLDADSATQTITLTHRGGTALDPESLRLRVSVDGEPIAHQPPIPFFASEGFMSGPTGPFNSADEGKWITGQSASVQLASTNTQFHAGSLISVRLYVDDTLLIVLETRAG